MKVTHPIPKAIGCYMKVLRNSAGLRSKSMSLDEVESATGITKAVLSNIESGTTKNPPFTMIVLLCKLYGVNPSSLTTMYPKKNSRHTRAIERFWTVLNDDERDAFAVQVEDAVTNHVETGSFDTAVVERHIGVLTGARTPGDY